MALTDILQNRALLIASALLSVAVFILCFPIRNRNLFTESMFFMLVLLTTSLINLLFTNNNIGGSLTLTGNLCLAFLYFQVTVKKLTTWVVAAYLITILFISYHLFVLGTHANYIYEELSRNHAGFALVFWTIFLLFHLKVTYNRLLLLPAVVGVVLSFFLFGRTSLIVSAVLVLVVFFYKFNRNLWVRVSAMGLFVGFCYFLWSEFGSVLLKETNLDAGLDTPRWKLWSIYWENIDLASIFTGVDVTKLPAYDQYSGNPHNSFIKFHSRVGIGSIFYIFLLLVSFFNYVKLKEYFIFWLLILLTVRAFFDSDMLIGNFDFIFLILTFYWVKTD